MKTIAKIARGPHEAVVTFNDELDEFRVRLNGRSRSDYFTTDRDDALGTAEAMLKSAAERAPVPGVGMLRRSALMFD